MNFLESELNNKSTRHGWIIIEPEMYNVGMELRSTRRALRRKQTEDRTIQGKAKQDKAKANEEELMDSS
jgi:hypothetical protein